MLITAGSSVHDGCQVQEAAPYRGVGEICGPDVIGPPERESFEQVAVHAPGDAEHRSTDRAPHGCWEPWGADGESARETWSELRGGAWPPQCAMAESSAVAPTVTPTSCSSSSRTSSTALTKSADPSPTASSSACTGPCWTNTSASWVAPSVTKASRTCRATSAPIWLPTNTKRPHHGRGVNGRTST